MEGSDSYSKNKQGKLFTFSKFHEKVQLKYEHMQMRLMKSQSTNCIDDLFVETKYSGNRTLSFSSGLLVDTEDANVEIIDYDEQEANIEDINTIFFSDSISNSQQEIFEDVKQDEELPKRKLFSLRKKNNNIFFNDDFSLKSSQSLSDISIDFSNSSASPSPSSSLRKRISDKFSAMREKRKHQTVLRERRDSWYNFRNSTKLDSKPVKRIKIATVTLALLEITGIDKLQEEKQMNYEKSTNIPVYFRLRLGNEKTRSKNVRRISSKYQWLDLFNFNYYGNDILELTLWNKDILIKKHELDLTMFEKEKTHKLDLEFDDLKDIKVSALLTITGTTENTVIDSENYIKTVLEMTSQQNKYAWYRFNDDNADVGFLSVIVYGAKGLYSQNCYCIVELDNERRQTATEAKTHDPTWLKKFVFNITDITSILEITVRDEKRSEDVGKISVPLLKINDGEKKWFALKDVTQRERAKGNNPRILLEMRLSWNLIRASIKVINPKEEKLLAGEPKVDTKLFASNITRSRAIISWMYGAFNIVKTCFEWESRRTNIIALTFWLIFCWNFKIWMLPLLLLIPFLWYGPSKYYFINWKNKTASNEEPDDGEIDDELAFAESKSEKEEKTTILQKIYILQAMVKTVQNTIGTFASFGECVKNLFNFTVPYISTLAILLLIIITLVMYLIPIKFIFMAWGIHKFTRKILRPNRIPNNEILDLISRVPNDIIMKNCDELPLSDTEDEEIKKL